MQVPKPDLIETAITKATTLRAKLVEMTQAGEYGEDPEKADAHAQKAEQLFKELRDVMVTARPFGHVEVHPKLKAKIAELRDGGLYPGWTEGHDFVLKAIGEAWKDLPISPLRRLLTDVVPKLWRQDSQEVAAGLTAGELKSCMGIVLEAKELDLVEQMGQEAIRVSREIELDLCPFEGFFATILPEQKDYQVLLEAVKSGDVARLDGAVHELKKIKQKLEAAPDWVKPDQKPNGQEQAGGLGAGGKKPDPIATAKAIIAKLKSLCRKPPEHTKLKQDEQPGTYGAMIGGEPRDFFGKDGLLWDMQSREPAGRVLQPRDINEATAGIDDLTEYLRLNGPGEAAQPVEEAWDDIRGKSVTVVYSERGPKNNRLVRLQHALELAIGYLSKAQRTVQPGDTVPGGRVSARPPAGGEMSETEIQQVREYADRVAELLEPMAIPPLERTWESEPPGLDDTSRVAQRIAAEWDRVLHPLKVEYRKKVIAVLGDSSWVPIADIFEHSQTLVRLDGWRQDILDHTDPGSSKPYWLESCGAKHEEYGPNPDLKNRIENIEGKLRRRAARAEQALSQAKADMREPDQRPIKPDIPGLIERLRTLRSALDSGDKELIQQAKTDLKAYMGSIEQMEDMLREFQSRCGADAHKNKHIEDAIRRAADIRTGGVPGYDYWFWDRVVATQGVIAELERGLVNEKTAGSAVQAEGEPKANLPNGREKPWDPNLPGYISITKAHRKYCDMPKAPTAATISRTHCKDDGEFDYMKEKQGRRSCRVNEEQFCAYAIKMRWSKLSINEARLLIEAWNKSPQGQVEAKIDKYKMHPSDYQ